MRRRRCYAFVLTFGMLFAWAGASAAQEADGFYKGRQIKFVVGANAGSTYDAVARLISRHMTRHIPGQPSAIAENMPGASSRAAANFAYNVAPQDGTVIVAVLRVLPESQLFDQENVRFDIGKFHWIGNPSSSVIAFAVWHTSPANSFEDLRRAEVIFGASGAVGSDAILPLVMNSVLGTKIKVVTGYAGSPAIDLAMIRGEVEGRGGRGFGDWQAAQPDWVKEGKIKFLLQVGLQRDPALPNVPLALELAQNDEQRQILRLFSTTPALGNPLLVGQNVPLERVKILRDAFRLTMSDPVFIKDAETARIEVTPIFGEELQKMIVEFLNYSPAVVEKAKKAMTR